MSLSERRKLADVWNVELATARSYANRGDDLPSKDVAETRWNKMLKLYPAEEWQRRYQEAKALREKVMESIHTQISGVVEINLKVPDGIQLRITVNNQEINLTY
jgi:hypothetical protein